MDIQNTALAFLAVILGAWLFSKLGKSGALAILLVVALIGGGVWTLLHSIQTFTATTRVAQVKASPVSNMSHSMILYLTTFDSLGNPIKSTYQLQGDRWGLYSEVVAYQPWCNWLGLSSSYELTRLVGQYNDNGAHAIQPVQLSNNPLFTVPILTRTTYTNGVLLPDDSVLYNVFVTPQGDIYASHA